MKILTFNSFVRMGGLLPLLLFFSLIVVVWISCSHSAKRRGWRSFMDDPFCQLAGSLALTVVALWLNLGYAVIREEAPPLLSGGVTSFQVLLILSLVSSLFIVFLERGEVEERACLYFWKMLPIPVAEALLISVLYWSGADIVYLKVGGYLSVLGMNLFMLLRKVRIGGWKDFICHSNNTYLMMILSANLLYLALGSIALIGDNVCLNVVTAILIVGVLYSLSLWWLIKGEKNFISFKMYGGYSTYRQDIRLLAEESLGYGSVEIKSRLFKLFEEEKPYLSPSFTIRDLATMLCTNQSYLSRFLNHGIKMNFNEFVNNFRVNEAIALFEENNNLPLSELCARSGFRNVSSFNNAFKRYTGSTPGEWCRKVKRIDDYEKAKDIM